MNDEKLAQGEGIEYKPIVDAQGCILAKTIDITDEVLDKIADRVLKKLRELELNLEIDF